MNIMLPVDGSHGTRAVLDYLASHEELFNRNNRYTVLHVSPSVPPQVHMVLSKSDIQGYYDADIEKVLDPVRAFFQERGVEARFVGRVGRTADTIVQLAEQEGCDMLVMGSHGRGALGNLVLGSVVANVMASTRTPVLVIR